MNYIQFVRYAKSHTTKKVFAMVRGIDYVREDAVQVALHRFARIFSDEHEKMLERQPLSQQPPEQLLVKYYYLDEIVDTPFQVTSASQFNVRVLRWVPGLMKQDDAEELISLLKNLYRFTVIVDPSEEVFSFFQNVYGKGSSGSLIDCGAGTFRQYGIIVNRPYVKDIDIPDDIAREIEAYTSLQETLNLIHIVEATGWEQLTCERLDHLKLLWVDPEKFLVEELFDKGKYGVLPYYLRTIDNVKFFRILLKELILRLGVKTIKGASFSKNAEDLELDNRTFKWYRDELKNQDIRELYRRLFLTLQLMRWGGYENSVLLLLLYW